jgi:hypothetical protein
MSEIFFNKVGFEITYKELDDILIYITDEFPELIYDIESSSQSSLIWVNNTIFSNISANTRNDNSFIITFSQDGESMWDLPVLHYLEPKIFSLIGDVNSQLRAYGLYVSDSDFGHTDAYYELVISKIGHKPKPLPKSFRDRGDISEDVSANASTAGSGPVSNAGVSSTSVSDSTPGSGDTTNTLKTKGQKMGSPSQVSDLRFLKAVKIKRVKDI